MLAFFVDPTGLGKILRSSQNIRAYCMLNHRIRKVYLFYEISRFTQEGLRTGESYMLALMLMLASISVFTCHRDLVVALVLALVLASPVKTTIQWISVNKTNCAIRWIAIYPVDSVIHPLNNRAQMFSNI